MSIIRYFHVQMLKVAFEVALSVSEKNILIRRVCVIVKSKMTV